MRGRDNPPRSPAKGMVHSGSPGTLRDSAHPEPSPRGLGVSRVATVATTGGHRCGPAARIDYQRKADVSRETRAGPRGDFRPTGMFHVKRQNSGRLAGIPERRGYSAGVILSLITSW